MRRIKLQKIKKINEKIYIYINFEIQHWLCYELVPLTMTQYSEHNIAENWLRFKMVSHCKKIKTKYWESFNDFFKFWNIVHFSHLNFSITHYLEHNTAEKLKRHLKGLKVEYIFKFDINELEFQQMSVFWPWHGRKRKPILEGPENCWINIKVCI